MSRPKELNFFVAELNWELGADWYASHFDRGAPVRGETSPHYTNLPAVRRRRRADARRCSARTRGSSTWSATRSTGCSRTTSTTSAAVTSRGALDEALGDPERPTSTAAATRCRSSPTCEAFGAERVPVVSREELRDDARDDDARGCSSSAGSTRASPRDAVRARVGDRQRQGGAGGFRLMDRAVRLPGLRALDRNFDRLPESLRWLVERLVHDPGRGAAPKPRARRRAARAAARGTSPATSPISSG